MATSRSDPRKVHALIVQAEACLQAGDHDGVLNVLAPLRGSDAAGIAANRMRGIVAFARGDFATAARQFARIVRAGGAAPEDHVNHGLAALQLGRLDAAAKSFRLALAQAPGHTEAWLNLGSLQFHSADFAAAEESFARLVALAPADARAWYNLGLARATRNRPRDAIAAYERALVLDPQLLDTWNNLGLAHAALGDHATAEASYRQLLARSPDHAPALANLGNALAARRAFDAALECLHRAAALAPAEPGIMHALAEVQLRTGRNEAAEATLRRVLALDPGHGRAMAALAMTLQWECDWDALDPLRANLIALALREARAGRRSPVAPHTALSQFLSPAEELEIARSWSRDLTDGMATAGTKTRFAYPPRRRDRIRLGYFSNDFNSQATAHLIVGLFERHDRTRFEVFAYSFGGDDGSDWRRRIEAASDAFIDVTDEDFAATAARMNADEIDILLDFKGFTAEARPQVYALRPAPVQVNYLGFPGTIGAEYLDYLIADEIVIPPSEQDFYAEKIVYLPECYQANDDRQPIADRPATRDAVGLPDGAIVYCCFNETYKIDRTIFAVWMRILEQVPDSVLWLRDQGPRLRRNLQAAASAAGIAASRLVFAPTLPKQEHLARCRLADLFLDSYALTAHTTATDALWAGVPVLTCPRNTFATRVGKSLLTHVGLPELAVADLGEYETMAVRLAHAPAALASLKARLVSNVKTEPLFDTARLTRHLEAAFEGMWRRHQAGEAPTGFRVEPVGKSLRYRRATGAPLASALETAVRSES